MSTRKPTLQHSEGFSQRKLSYTKDELIALFGLTHDYYERVKGQKRSIQTGVPLDERSTPSDTGMLRFAMASPPASPGYVV